MSTDIATLGIKVDSSDVGKANNELKILIDVGVKAEKATDGIANSFGGLKTALAGLGIGAIAREAIQMADSYANIQGRLANVTSGTAELARVSNELFEVSQRSRASFEATTDLYGSLARSTKTLGVAQKEVISVTETINKALIVSGASAQTAEGALRQLGQGFASGTLRGDELNSVLEGTPRLAQAIADGMGITVGALRAAGAEGKITGEAVFNALKSQKDAIEKEFARMPVTVAQSFVVLKNEVLRYVGETDAGIGKSMGLAGSATALLATGIAGFAKNLDVVIPLVVTLGTALGVGFVANAVAARIAAMQAAGGMVAVGAAAKSAGTAMLGAFGGPIGLAITAVAVGIGYYASESSKAAQITDTVNKSFDDMRKRLDDAKRSADSAAGGSKSVGTAAAAAAPGVDTLSASVARLANNLYRQADAAKKARIETAAAALAEANKNAAAANANTAGGREATRASNWNAIKSGDLLSVSLTPVIGDLRNTLSGGRADRQARLDAAKATLVAQQAQRDYVEALKSTNGEVRNTVNVNSAAIKKLSEDTANLQKLRASATGEERKRIDARIKANSRKVELLKAGNDEDAVNYGVGSGGTGRGGGKPEKSEAERERESATKASEQYVEQLKREAGAIGLNAAETKLYEARIAAAKAPTKELATEIMNAASAFVMQQASQEASLNIMREIEAANDNFKRQNQEQQNAAKEYADDLQFETDLQKMSLQQREVAIAMRNLETRGIKEGTVAWALYGEQILNAANAKGALAQQAEDTSRMADEMRDLSKSVDSAAQSFGNLFGKAGGGFAELVDIITDFSDRSAEAQERLAQVRERYGEGSIEYEREQIDIQRQARDAEMESYSRAIGGVKRMFNEKSKAYKAIQAIEQTYAAIRTAMALKELLTEGLLTTAKVSGAGARMATDAAETASSVSKSGIRAAADGVAAFAKTVASLPFPLNLVAGAAVLAALVGVGVKIAGGGGKKGATASAAEKQEIKPTDYTREPSRYSVNEAVPGYANSNSPGGAGSFASNNNSPASFSGKTENNFNYKIEVNGNDNADDVERRVRGVMEDYQADTVRQARQAVQQDNVRNAGRQNIGGIL